MAPVSPRGSSRRSFGQGFLLPRGLCVVWVLSRGPADVVPYLFPVGECCLLFLTRSLLTTPSECPPTHPPSIAHHHPLLHPFGVQGWRTLIKPGSKVGDKTVDPEFGDFTWLSYREVWDRVQCIGSGLVDRDLIPESGPERVRCPTMPGRVCCGAISCLTSQELDNPSHPVT